MDAKIEPADEPASLFEDLQDSEINGEIGWFFDGVWRAKIGDPWKGYCAGAEGLPSLGEAARWLCDQALHLYPDSDFAKEYLRTHPGYRAHFPREKPTPPGAVRTGRVRSPVARRHRR
jgi:hypothetical protein